jgi:hypothetical protein
MNGDESRMPAAVGSRVYYRCGYVEGVVHVTPGHKQVSEQPFTEFSIRVAILAAVIPTEHEKGWIQWLRGVRSIPRRSESGW